MKLRISVFLFVISTVLIAYSIFNKQKLANYKPEFFRSIKSKVLGDTNKNSTYFIDSNLLIEDLIEGEGDSVELGDKIKVNYVGTLTDGTIFDTNLGSEPIEFTLQQGGLIEGWIQGIPGMKVGGKRRLVIPPELGYGAQPVGDIPPYSTLIFEVELFEIVETTDT